MASATGNLTEQLTQLLKNHESALWTVNTEIHSNPELRYQEVHAHDTFCRVLGQLGYSVKQHAYGLKTSFEVECGSGGPLVIYNAEYDALPGIGHACGHNLISTSSLAAFLLTAETLRAKGIEGRVRLLGTPAEEDGGGKIDLIEAGAYKGADACLMGHPVNRQESSDGVGLMRTMARVGGTVTFRGVNAHAGNAPWLGRNALDACVAAYTNIAMLRQQTPPNQRLHAIISNGGEQPNIIPDLTEMRLYVRAETMHELEATREKVINCCEGAAKSTGCTVSFEWSRAYKELISNEAIAERFMKATKDHGLNYTERMPSVSGASTDQGNVCFELPSLHPAFMIDVDNTEIGPHHPGFKKSAGTRSAFEDALRFGKALAAAGLDILQEKDLREKMWAEHKDTFSNKQV